MLYNKKFTEPNSKRFMNIALMASLFLLTGCATLSKEECAYADWYTIGLEDGSKGYASSYIGQHRKACSKHGVVVDIERYTEGRSKGLEVFCTHSSGFEHGRRGKNYGAGCPATLEERFLVGYRAGKAVRAAEKDYKSSQKDFYAAKTDLAKNEEAIETLTLKIVHEDMTPMQRLQTLKDIDARKARSEDLVDEILGLEDAMDVDYSQFQFLQKKYSPHH